MFNTINTIASGMTANKLWLDVTANNITNINTTRQQNGNPYHRQTILLESKTQFDDLFNREIGGGVKVKSVVEDKTEKVVYEPNHPDANEEGYVRYPDINLAAEMTNMMMAQRSYEANVSTFDATKKIMEKELTIGR
jgi:flagellar basal-body rod protein FlgC